MKGVPKRVVTANFASPTVQHRARNLQRIVGNRNAFDLQKNSHQHDRTSIMHMIVQILHSKTNYFDDLKTLKRGQSWRWVGMCINAHQCDFVCICTALMWSGAGQA